MPDATMQKSSDELIEAASLPTQMENLSVSYEIGTSSTSAHSACMAVDSTRFSFVKNKMIEEHYVKSCKLKTNGSFKNNIHIHCMKNHGNHGLRTSKHQLPKQLPKRKFLQPNLNLPMLDLGDMPSLSLHVHLDKIDGICKIECVQKCINGNVFTKMQK
jgi:hypothetical protein